jgi:hypothetical protein
MKDTDSFWPTIFFKYVVSKFYVFEYSVWWYIFVPFVYALVLSVLSRMSTLTVMQHVLNISLINYEMWVKRCSFRTLDAAMPNA